MDKKNKYYYTFNKQIQYMENMTNKQWDICSTFWSGAGLLYYKLRNNLPLSKDDKQLLKNMKQIFINIPRTTRDIVLYRGMAMNDQPNTNTEYKLLHYISTTPFMKISKDFTKEHF